VIKPLILALGLMGLALLLAMGLSACSRPPEPIVLGGETMGTYWTVRVSSMPDSLTESDLSQQIGEVLERVNAEMSTYRADSVISQFNQASPGTEFILPDGFLSVLKQALYWARITNGAFDPTAGPLINLWGFGPDSTDQRAPAAHRILEAREKVGWQRLSLKENSRTLSQPGDLYLDLSAIAKGWGVDQVADHLIDAGIDNFLVDIGGELRVSGLRPDATRWRIGVERPGEDTREAVTIIEVEDVAIATSGSYRNFFEEGGDRFSHLIDPRTGRPIEHHTVSVTVIAESAIAADAMATALSIMPIDEAEAFASQRDIAVFWLLLDGQSFTEQMTPAFRNLMERTNG
jgi:thiamine biosynthesis lipoprotein